MQATVATLNEGPRLAGWTRVARRSALQEMLSIASRPGLLSFSLGLPAPELFPTAAYAKAVEDTLSSDAGALQYGPPSQSLKREIVALMAQRGVTCAEDQIFLTSGAQQGMNLLARLLLDPGGQVIVEELTYTGFQQVIEPFEPDILTVPTDLDSGIDVDAVESLLKGGARPAFIYTITDGQNPLAVSMEASKRARLAALARRYRVPIIEDDAYGFLSYDDSPPPLRALDEQWVYYVGSFSKILAPALRVGWIVAPQDLASKLSVIKEASDIDTATFSQRTVAAYLEAGHLPGHLGRLRLEYGSRRDAMINALTRHFPPQARWRKPSAGVFLWVELPFISDTSELLKISVETERVTFIPGQAFCIGGRGDATNCIRLNFSNCSTEKIEDGIARLGRILRAAV